MTTSEGLESSFAEEVAQTFSSAISQTNIGAPAQGDDETMSMDMLLFQMCLAIRTALVDPGGEGDDAVTPEQIRTNRANALAGLRTIIGEDDKDPSEIDKTVRGYAKEIEEAASPVKQPQRVETNYESIPPPVYGGNKVDAKSRKAMVGALNAQPYTGPKGRITTFHLMDSLRKIVETYELSPQGSWDLLLTVCLDSPKQWIRDRAALNMDPRHGWLAFQSAFRDIIDPEEALEQINELKKTPPTNIAATLSRVVSLTRQAHVGYPSSLRSQQILFSARATTLAIVRRFYPSISAQVEGRESRLRADWTTSRQKIRKNPRFKNDPDALAKALDDLPLQYHPLESLIQIIITETADLAPVQLRQKETQGHPGSHTGPQPHGRQGQPRPQTLIPTRQPGTGQQGSALVYAISNDNQESWETASQMSTYSQHGQVYSISGPNPDSNRNTGGNNQGTAKKMCIFDGFTGHSWRECRRYPGDLPADSPCPDCSWYHTIKPCRKGTPINDIPQA